MKIKKGDIFYAVLRAGVGSEQCGQRPVIIVSNDIGNEYAPTVIVAPITSRTKKALPTHTIITNKALQATSLVLAEQLITLDKSRLCNKIGKLTADEMARVNSCVRTSLQL